MQYYYTKAPLIHHQNNMIDLIPFLLLICLFIILDTSYSRYFNFINLTYHHKSENKDKDNKIFITGRLIDKMKSDDDYNIIITNEMKVLDKT